MKILSDIETGLIQLGHASDTTIARVSAGVVSIEGANILVSAGALGTPASGTLTNCTGLPVAGITASTSTALGVGSVELGHATDTTLSRVSAGLVAIEGVNVVTETAVQTLTNKTLTSPTLTTPTIDGQPALGVTITSAAQGDVLARTATGYVNVNVAVDKIVGRLGSGEVVGITCTSAGRSLIAVSTAYGQQDSLSVHGADVASSGTTNLETATGDLIDVTGTTTITAITLSEGHERTVRFTGILTLTHGASLVLPGSANITTAAGDFAIFRGYAAGVVRCVSHHPLGVYDPTRLGSGASIATKYLRGDSTWQTLAGGGDAVIANGLAQFAAGTAATSAQMRGMITDESGAGLAVFNDTPTLITPVIGVATATSINKVAITAPATSATLTLTDGTTVTGPTTSGTIATTDTAQAVTGAKTFGTAGGAVSKLKIAGSTSGTIALDTQAVAGTGQIMLPTGPATLASLDGAETLTAKTLTSPTLTTPVLGTPASGTLTNCTGLPASGISSGTIATARLGSGTANSTTFLRGDQTWAEPSGLTQGQAVAIMRGAALSF